MQSGKYIGYAKKADSTHVYFDNGILTVKSDKQKLSQRSTAFNLCCRPFFSFTITISLADFS